MIKIIGHYLIMLDVAILLRLRTYPRCAHSYTLFFTMKTLIKIVALTSLLSGASVGICQTAAKRISVPYKPDPAFTIDGDLSDWNNVPGR